MISPPVLRAMRAALGWSMRDAEQASGVALKTIYRAEQGEPMTASTARRLRIAFRKAGVLCESSEARWIIRINPGPPSSVKAGAAADLFGLPYVVLRPRADGTHRVLFEVPKTRRPPGWPPSRPLPQSGRTGRLDEREVQAIKADAKRLMSELQRARQQAERSGVDGDPQKTAA